MRSIFIELHRLSRKERKMICHQNPGPGYQHLCLAPTILFKIFISNRSHSTRYYLKRCIRIKMRRGYAFRERSIGNHMWERDAQMCAVLRKIFSLDSTSLFPSHAITNAILYSVQLSPTVSLVNWNNHLFAWNLCIVLAKTTL